ncbi:mucin-binding protein [Fructilactobacillus fructivorans]|uniref:mucin-binding protein n=1 Tax=Fructilactobacillus fructivorans TaxID=1614 RepID=UPI001F3FE214|nr:MucBP domain-containing protein [Fructilactobacillus fructivorans]
MDSKKRFKMYKAGKKWMVAAIVTSFTIGGLTIGASADTTVPSSASNAAAGEKTQETTGSNSNQSADYTGDQSQDASATSSTSQTDHHDQDQSDDSSKAADQATQPTSKSQSESQAEPKNQTDQSDHQTQQPSTQTSSADQAKDKNAQSDQANHQSANDENHQAQPTDSQVDDASRSNQNTQKQQASDEKQSETAKKDDQSTHQTDVNSQPDQTKPKEQTDSSDQKQPTDQPDQGQKQATNNTKLASEDSNNSLPKGLSITSDQISAPSSNNFNQFGTMVISNHVAVNDADVTINPGDRIVFNIANSSDAGSDALMKKVINWNRISMTGGTDYGHLEVNANGGQAYYVFDKTIRLTTGMFSFTLNVPFQSDPSVQLAGVNFSSEFQQENVTYPLDQFYYGYVASSNIPSPGRVQAPGLRARLGGNEYAGVTSYDGSTANNPIAESNGTAMFDPTRGDHPSFTNVLYPNADPDGNLNNLTNRTWTVDIKGNGASFDLSGLRFGIPRAGLPYSVSWAGDYAGQWITLDQLKQVLPGIQVQMDQINSNDARLSLIFPNGVGIQYLQFTGNFVAPDVSGKYAVNFGYHDDQGTNSNNSIDMNLAYQINNEHGFFPTISASDKSLNADTFDINNLDHYLLDGTSVNDVQDGANKDAIKVSDDAALRNAIINHQAGTYTVTYQTTNSLGLTSYKSISVTVYVSQDVTDSTTGTTTIHYVDQNGKEVAPDREIKAHFTRTGKRDPLTNDVSWGDWDSDDSGYNITSPTIADMTPNMIHVSGNVLPDENNSVTVVYSNNTEQVSDQATGQKKIRYVDQDGNKVASSKTITAHFTRTGTRDVKTGDITWGDWTSDDTHYDVASPEIDNMTPDKSQVSGTITMNENDSENVVYTDNTEQVNDETTGQKTINYVDHDGNEVAPSKTVIAHFTRTGTKNMRTGNVTWNDWTSNDNHYQITVPVVDNMTPDKQQVSGTLTPDENETEDVVYSNNTEQVTDQTTGQTTINYVDSDGKEVAPSKTVTAHFTRTGTKDLRTGKIEWNGWTSNDNHYEITSPTIANMTPDKQRVSGTLVPNEDNVENVVYSKNEPEATKPTPNENGSHPSTPDHQNGGNGGNESNSGENQNSNSNRSTSNENGNNQDVTSGENSNSSSSNSMKPGENSKPSTESSTNEQQPSESAPRIPAESTQQPRPKGTVVNSNQAKTSKKNQLPQTGERSHSILVAVGGLLLALAGMLGLGHWIKRRKKSQ